MCATIGNEIIMNENLIKHQKTVADEVLSRMEIIDPFCIVAGGAPRDWFHGRIATDIDLFFSVKQGVQIGVIINQLAKAGFIVTDTCWGQSIPEWYKLNPCVRAVFNTDVAGQKTQMILLSTSTFDVVDQFPLSICKAWYKRGNLRTTKDFDRTVKHKAIYKTSELYANGHVYLQKILAKFPDYDYYDSVSKLAEKLLDNS